MNTEQLVNLTERNTTSNGATRRASDPMATAAQQPKRAPVAVAVDQISGVFSLDQWFDTLFTLAERMERANHGEAVRAA